MSTFPWSDIPTGRDAIPASEDPSTPHRFMWALQNRRFYTLLYLIDLGESVDLNLELPRLQSIEIYITPSSPCYLAISLLDSSFADIFLDLCNDLIDSTRHKKTREEGLVNLINRCWRWQSLLYRKGSPLLSLQEQQGLFSEMSFLLNHLAPSLGISRSLEMWQGPYGSYHDFVSGSIDIEIKSIRTTGVPRIKVSSEHQLERPPNKDLFLVCYALSNDQSTGYSVNSIAEQLSALIAESAPSVSGLFQSLLDEAGFAWSHDYENSRWSIQSLSCYEVRAGFPSIIRSSILPAIMHVEYDLNPMLLGDFSSSVSSILTSLI